MSTTEYPGALAWIMTTIAADATIAAVSGYGGAFEGLAPDGTTTPYIVVQLMSGQEVLTANGTQVYQDQVWQIKAVAPSSKFASLVSIAVRLNAIFGSFKQQGSSAVSTTGVRQSEIALTEVVNGELWSHMGGLYRLATILK